MTSQPVPVLRGFANFLARPTILRPTGLRAPGAWRDTGAMLAFHLAVMLLLVLPVVSLWQRTNGLPAPEAFGKFPHLFLVPFVVLAAPLAEETLFRGWQTGRPRALWLLAAMLAGAGAIAAAHAAGSDLGVTLAFFGALVAAPAGWWVLRRRQSPPRAFAAAFPVVFYLVAALFAAVHLANYPAVTPALLPMVLPQLWAGLVLGYVRQRTGLAASMLVHAGANAVSLGIALAASAF